MRDLSAFVLIMTILGSTACSNKSLETGGAATPPPTRAEVMEKKKESLRIKGIEKSQPEDKTAVLGEVPEAMLKAVRADLDARTGGKQALLVRTEAVTWPDGAMGCPQPGMMYPQVIIDGYHVVYEVEGKLWDYRLNDRGGFRLCEGKTRRSLSTPLPSE